MTFYTILSAAMVLVLAVALVIDKCAPARTDADEGDSEEGGY